MTIRTTIEFEAKRIVDSLRGRITVEEVLTPPASPIPTIMAAATKSIAAERRLLLEDQRARTGEEGGLGRA